TEAAVELCRLAGLPPVGMLVEAVDDDGEPIRLPELRRLADEHGLPLISIADLITFLDSTAVRPPPAPAPPPAPSPPMSNSQPRVTRVADTWLPTRHGTFRAIGYRDPKTGEEHVALVAGTPPAHGSLVRVHSECLTGDALGSQRCDCGPQLDAALAAV